MAFGPSGIGTTKSDINVTPLIDVLLVLLIIFMLVTPLLTTALDADVPRAAGDPLPAAYSERQLVLRLDADGRWFLNREETSLTRLPARLRAALASRGTAPIMFLDADDGIPYGTVVQAMDLCRGAGATHIGLVTDALQASP